MTALARANQVRLQRAYLKRQVRAGERTAAEVLSAPPEEAQTMIVTELLMAQVRWGRTRTRRVLLHAAVPEHKRVGELTARQRDAIAAALENRPAAAPAPRWGALEPSEAFR